MKYLAIIICAGIMSTGLFGQSRWQTRHYEPTDNAFTDAAALDSITAILCGNRDHVAGILFKTTNGGLSWQELRPWTVEQNCFNLAIDFVDRNIGYVSAMGVVYGFFVAAVLYKTTDGGSSWTRIYGLTFDFVNKLWDDVFFLDANNGWLAGANSDIRRTTNGGTSWTIQSAPVSGSLRSIYFLNPSMGWIVGGDYDTLTGQGRNGLILRTTNGGTTWTAQISNAPYQFWGVHFIDNLNGWVCGLKDTASPGVFFRTTNGGTSWTEIMAPAVSIGRYGLHAIEFIDSQNGFAVGGGNRLGWTNSHFGIFLKTTNGGNNWFVDTIIFDNSPWGVAPLGMDMFNVRWGYAGGTRLSAFRYGPLNVSVDEQEIIVLDKGMGPTVFSSKQRIIFDINNYQNVRKAVVYDALGRKVFEKRVLNSSSLIVPELGKGCYFLKLYKTERNSFTKKFVVL